MPRERRLSPRARRVALTCHIVVAVGWLGLVAAMLVIGSSLLRSSESTSAGYAVMELLGTRTLPGFALAATLTGLVLGIGTRWGIVRHGWVAAKLVMAVVVAVTGAMVTAPLLEALADDSSDPGAVGSGRPVALVVLSATHLVLLVAATALSVHKPRGRRPGRKRPHVAPAAVSRPRGRERP